MSILNKIASASFLVFISLHGLAQTADEEYFRLCLKGNSFYDLKKYKQSTEAYSQAFQIRGAKIKTPDRYNAACSWSLAGFPDSAYTQLFLAASKGYEDYYHIISDPDLELLHPDKRWKPLLDSIQKNKAKNAVGPYAHLKRLLESIFYTDQKYRLMIEGYEQRYGRNSKEMKALWDSTLKQDEANLKIIKQVLDMYGWLGSDAIGSQANSTLFLVIQHSDQETQEKYLPMMREAVKEGNANASALALLEDRVALRQGKKQIYGSQIGQDPETGKYIVSPIEDEANVNKRRAGVGLGPLEEYVKQWGIIYVPGVATSKEQGFWERNQLIFLEFSALVLFALVCFILYKFFTIQLFRSPWFWFYFLMLSLLLISNHQEAMRRLNFHNKESTILYLLWHLSCFSFILAVSCCLNWVLHKLFRQTGHLLIELLTVGISILLFLVCGNFIFHLFFPENNSFRMNLSVIPILVVMGFFLLIKTVFYIIRYFQRRKRNEYSN